MTAGEIKNDYRLLVIGEVIKWETTGEEELGNKRRSFFSPFLDKFRWKCYPKVHFKQELNSEWHSRERPGLMHTFWIISFYIAKHGTG